MKSKSYFAITIIVSMFIIGLMNFDKIYNLFAGNEDYQVVVVTEKEELYSTHSFPYSFVISPNMSTLHVAFMQQN